MESKAHVSVVVAVLMIISAFVLASGASSGRRYPAIVASVQLREQSGPIPDTPLVVPVADGVYRISTYMSETAPGSANDTWELTTSWTDQAGKEQNLQYLIGSAQVAPNASIC